MTRRWTGGRSLVVLLSMSVAVAFLPPGTGAAERLAPEEVVGPRVCAECHDAEFRVWEGTAHAKLYDSDEPLHRRERSREIAGNLGVRLVQHDSLCLSCHFTPTERVGRVTALAGVSCESCHGAAREWIHVHNTYEGRSVRRADETAEARQRRVERNVSLGMYTPARIYELASRCYGCHVVPEEELVVVGQHTSGGPFDLAERIDAIRHNFVSTGRQGNAPLPIELRRKLEVLAPALELEHSLRALAEADDPEGTYSTALVRRAEKARRDLSRLVRVVALPEARGGPVGGRGNPARGWEPGGARLRRGGGGGGRPEVQPESRREPARCARPDRGRRRCRRKRGRRRRRAGRLRGAPRRPGARGGTGCGRRRSRLSGLDGTLRIAGRECPVPSVDSHGRG